MIRVERISKAFNGRIILHQAEMAIPDHTIVGLVGESGIGKSTLAKMLCGVLSPDDGQIFLNDTPLWKNGIYNRSAGRAIQMVYQQPHAALDPLQRIGKGFEELMLYHQLSKNKEEARRRTVEMLSAVELAPEIAQHLPHQISGGEAQRVCIARALLFQPQLLILDEATSMLDVLTQANVVRMIRDVMKKNGGSILLISHDEALVDAVCHEKFVCKNNHFIKERSL